MKTSLPCALLLGLFVSHVEAKTISKAISKDGLSSEKYERMLADTKIQHFQQEALQRVSIDDSSRAAFIIILPEISEGCRRGNQLSQYDMGFAYEHGVGVVKNLAYSYVFYTRASFGNDEKIKEAALKGVSDVGMLLTKVQHDVALFMLFGAPNP